MLWIDCDLVSPGSRLMLSEGQSVNSAHCNPLLAQTVIIHDQQPDHSAAVWTAGLAIGDDVIVSDNIRSICGQNLGPLPADLGLSCEAQPRTGCCKLSKQNDLGERQAMSDIN